MRESLPENGSATPCKGTLNNHANPSRTVSDGLTEGDQFFLGSPDARCRDGAARIAELVHQAQRDNGFTLGTIAGLAGKGISNASRAFDLEDPHTVLRFVAAVILLDKKRSFLWGLARLAGGEFVDRPKLTWEQKFTMLEQTCQRHGKLGEALIVETFGENEP